MAKKIDQPEQPKDDLQKLLQAALKQQRPRRSRVVLAVTLAATAVLAFFVWLLYPKGEPPLLVVVAFDDVGAKGAEVTLHGRLEAATDPSAALDRKRLFFVDGQPPSAPGEKPKEVEVLSGRDGAVSCNWKFPPELDEAEVIVRLFADKFRPGMEDRGRVVLAPPGTRLCLVQIDSTITPAKEQAWRQVSIQNIGVVAGAAEALQEARSAGYQVVYLALSADKPTLYQKMRGWVRDRGADGTPPLPSGAVLGRFTLPEPDQAAKPWQKTAQRVLTTLPAPKEGHIAIAGTIDVAQQLHAAGLRTIYIGPGADLPPEVRRVAGWDDVRQEIAK